MIQLLQDEALGFTALTMYISTCMIFIACAMLYYGIILFNLRKILKVADSANATNEKDIKLNNSIIRCDKIMLFFFLIIFFLFNAFYFIIYLSIWK